MLRTPFTWNSLFLLFALLTLPGRAEPGLLLTAERNATVRQSHILVLAYSNGQEYLFLSTQAETSLPTSALRILPLPSPYQRTSDIPQLGSTLLQWRKEELVQPEYTEENLAIVQALEANKAAEIESRQLHLRVSDPKAFDDLAAHHLGRPLSAQERKILKSYLDQGLNNFSIESCYLEGKGTLPTRAYLFETKDVFLPTRALGQADSLCIHSLIDRNEFGWALQNELKARLTDEFGEKNVIVTDDFNLPLHQKFSILSESLAPILPFSTIQRTFLATGSRQPETDIRLSTEGELARRPGLKEGLWANYLPLRERNHWNYLVKARDGHEFQRKVTLDTVDKQNDGSLLFRLVESSPDTTRERWYTIFDGQIEYETRQLWGEEESLHFNPALPLYAACSFVYPEVGVLSSPVPGTTRVYEGKVRLGQSEPVWYQETFHALYFEKVTVPAGTFRALRTQVYPDCSIPTVGPRIEWYADGVGLIKSVEGVGDFQVVSELTDYLIEL